jgi:site-specific DNA recombinase
MPLPTGLAKTADRRQGALSRPEADLPEMITKSSACLSGGPTMTPEASSAPLRCAVYTRTSRDDEDDPGFSSMDAQFEACYGYIAVRHPVISGLPTTASYADAGFSGGTLDRPALQRMLADIEADRVDLVVVHKIDRLSRSLVHFVQLMEIFERHHVTLVAVTQHLNSHDAAGRMAIHALMSFAQFEREATGERIRDKMRATRRLRRVVVRRS